jgi:Lon protease-like protein
LFGVTFERMLNREIGLPHVNSIGCIARILKCHTFASGDSNVKVHGLARYRIVRYLETDKPYPVAEIKFFEEENERYHGDIRLQEEARTAPEREELLTKTRVTLQRVQTKLFRALGDKDYEAPMLPQVGAVETSFLVSRLFIFDEGDRLHLLNSPCPIHRMKFIIERLEEVEERVDDNLERAKFLAPFMKLANNRDNPNLN